MVAKELVVLVNSHRIPNNLLTSIVTECWNLIQVFTQCCQTHNYKETNACGDAVATGKESLSARNCVFIYFESPADAIVLF